MGAEYVESLLVKIDALTRDSLALASAADTWRRAMPPVCPITSRPFHAVMSREGTDQLFATYMRPGDHESYTIPIPVAAQDGFIEFVADVYDNEKKCWLNPIQFVKKFSVSP